MHGNSSHSLGQVARRIGVVLLILAVGFAIGRWTASGAMPADMHAGHTGMLDEKVAEVQIWTCSMHPQIRMPNPGNCPICGMKLVPAKDAASSGSLVVLGEEAQRVASIEVEAVRRQALVYPLRTVGRVEFAEPNVANLTARVAGRVERVYADYTGVDVARGDHLVDIYAPELVVAQEEFLLGLRALGATPDAGQQGERDRARADLSRQKLILLGVSDAQIEELQKTGKPSEILTVHAPIGGTVVAKNVREQTYVETGDPLYEIADLSRVWLIADVYEYELPWVVRGESASVVVEALPGESFEGLVAFVDPRVDEASRTIKVRINLDNPKRLLKPGMFAHVTIRAELGPDGKHAPSILAGKFTCPMHPEVVADAPGKCPLCQMDLVREPGEPVMSGSSSELPLSVPTTAVLSTGTRNVVWVEREPGRFELAELTLGPRAVGFYPVLGGLNEGDRVVVHGNFLLDSQSQIEGKPSLLFPKGLEPGASAPAGHAGH